MQTGRMQPPDLEHHVNKHGHVLAGVVPVSVAWGQVKIIGPNGTGNDLEGAHNGGAEMLSNPQLGYKRSSMALQP